MGLKSNKGFSLIEVIVTAAIFATAAIFIFRSYTAVISGLRTGTNLNLACLLAEEKIWEIKFRNNLANAEQLQASGSETLREREFKWEYFLKDVEEGSPELKEVDFTVTWQEPKGPRDLKLSTYLYNNTK